jgi:hypothetical protein
VAPVGGAVACAHAVVVGKPSISTQISRVVM